MISIQNSKLIQLSQPNQPNQLNQLNKLNQLFIPETPSILEHCASINPKGA